MWISWRSKRRNLATSWSWSTTRRYLTMRSSGYQPILNFSHARHQQHDSRHHSSRMRREMLYARPTPTTSTLSPQGRTVQPKNSQHSASRTLMVLRAGPQMRILKRHAWYQKRLRVQTRNNWSLYVYFHQQWYPPQVHFRSYARSASSRYECVIICQKRSRKTVHQCLCCAPSQGSDSCLKLLPSPSDSHPRYTPPSHASTAQGIHQNSTSMHNRQRPRSGFDGMQSQARPPILFASHLGILYWPHSNSWQNYWMLFLPTLKETKKRHKKKKKKKP